MGERDRMRSAREIAAEVVPEAWIVHEDDGTWFYTSLRTTGGEVAIRLGDDPSVALGGTQNARAAIAALIEQARHDGAVEALREADRRIKLAVPGSHGVFAEGLSKAARITRELASRPRRF